MKSIGQEMKQKSPLLKKKKKKKKKVEGFWSRENPDTHHTFEWSSRISCIYAPWSTRISKDFEDTKDFI